ncbi:NAD(P)-dependent oxidoreductase [Aerococcaceae bacterium WGS1372]
MKISLLEPLRVPKEYIEELADGIKELGHEFVYYEDKTTDPDELYERSKDSEVVIIGNNPYPKEVIERLDTTKLINVAFTGVDHVDAQTAKAKGIKIANASGYSTQAVAELSLGLTLNLLRQVNQGNIDVRQAEDFPGLIQGKEIHGRTVGIIGTGAIGLNTAKLFNAFGAKLIAYNRSQKQEALDMGVEYKSLEDLLKESDIVSIHLPLTEDTKHTIGAKELEQMKESAILVNVAIGPVVDNQALAEALNNEQIAGAGIDVFDMEPALPADYPLLHAKNTLLTPHIGYLTDEAMVLRAQIAFDNVIAYINGEEKNIVTS